MLKVTRSGRRILGLIGECSRQGTRLTARMIADRLNLSRGGVYLLLDRLEEMGRIKSTQLVDNAPHIYETATAASTDATATTQALTITPKDLSKYDKRVLVALIYSKSIEKRDPSVSEIVERTAKDSEPMSRAGVKNSIKRLKAAGLIDFDRLKDERGVHSVNSYRMMMEKIPTALSFAMIPGLECHDVWSAAAVLALPKIAQELCLFYRCICMSSPMLKDAQTLAQEQLEAYNKGDLNAFLLAYSPHVEAHDLARGELLFKGLDSMAGRYGPYFKANPQLHCELVGRLAMGAFCIDQEVITGLAESGTVRALAIYQAKDGLISKIWFLRE